MFSDVSGNMCVSLGGGGIGPVLQYAHMQSGGLLGGAQAGTTKGADTSFPFYLNLRCEPSPLVWLNSVPKGTRDNAWCLLMHTKASVSLSSFVPEPPAGIPVWYLEGAQRMYQLPLPPSARARAAGRAPGPCSPRLEGAQVPADMGTSGQPGYDPRRWPRSPLPRIPPTEGPQGRRLPAPRAARAARARGRGLHSPTFRLNLSAFCGIGRAIRG